MKRIPLGGKYGKGKFALIDDCDFERVSNYMWYLSQGYPTTNLGHGRGNRVPIKLHRFILNPPKGQSIDHINQDPLDNRRENLRYCTKSQNAINSSKYKGYYYFKQCKRWCVQIQVNSKTKHIGLYKTEEEAREARKKAELEYFGEFARRQL